MKTKMKQRTEMSGQGSEQHRFQSVVFSLVYENSDETKKLNVILKRRKITFMKKR